MTKYLKFLRMFCEFKKGLGTRLNVTPHLREIALLHLTARQRPVNYPSMHRAPAPLMMSPGTLILKGIHHYCQLAIGLHGYHALLLGTPSSEC